MGEEGRAKLLFDERVSVACWVDILDVGVVLVDGEVIRRGPSQSDVSSKYADSTPSTSPESLVTDVPSGSVICTGGSSPPDRGGSTKAALQPNRSGNSLTLFALTTLPVSASMSA